MKRNCPNEGIASGRTYVLKGFILETGLEETSRIVVRFAISEIEPPLKTQHSMHREFCKAFSPAFNFRSLSRALVSRRNSD